MPSRPGWNDDYWKTLDKNTAKKIRTSCPKCGSTRTSYNARFGVWQCGSCEHIFTVQGYGKQRPWWKRLFKRD
jgi:ribosomal protein L37AE/L43A